MLYSSGTTGRPKGIWRPLADPAAIGPGLPPFARDLAQVFGFGPATRWISPGPLYHAAPLRFSLAVNAAGGLVAVMEKFEAREALRLIDALELTDTQWVPTMFQRLLALPEAERRAFRGTSHRRAIHGAAPCTPALKRAMIAWWGPILDEYYAGSESIGLTRLDSTEWLAHPGSVGRPAIGTAHILGEGDEELPAGATGRVFFGGRPGFGYFGDDGKTATRTSRQGWQSLGDIGHVDTEGYLYLSDRLDDMIISGGVNVYPQEIEAAIEEVEGVLECGVVGMPDPEFDERPVAFVVAARPGETEALRERLLRHLGERLGRIRQPREIHFVTELPRSPAGKLLRRELRSRA
jgi:acyl-CoA synthetase (AMP-forming)/AMP-acid ligase II